MVPALRSRPRLAIAATGTFIGALLVLFGLLIGALLYDLMGLGLIRRQ